MLGTPVIGPGMAANTFGSLGNTLSNLPTARPSLPDIGNTTPADGRGLSAAGGGEHRARASRVRGAAERGCLSRPGSARFIPARTTRISQNLPQLRFSALGTALLKWRCCMGRKSVRAHAAMTVKEYVLRRLDQGESDVEVLARQTRIQFPGLRISANYIRRIRNERQKALALT